MFELAAAFVLALIYAIIIGVRKGAHKEGPQGVVGRKNSIGVVKLPIGTHDATRRGPDLI